MARVPLTKRMRKLPKKRSNGRMAEKFVLSNENNLVNRRDKTMQQPTKYYYFSMGRTIYYGNDTEFTFFKSMDRHPISDVEREVKRLNTAANLVAPVDEDFEDEEN
jgi:hypothetical protein